MNHFLEELNIELIVIPFVIATFLLIQVWS